MAVSLRFRRGSGTPQEAATYCVRKVAHRMKRRLRLLDLVRADDESFVELVA